MYILVYKHVCILTIFTTETLTFEPFRKRIFYRGRNKIYFHLVYLKRPPFLYLIIIPTLICLYNYTSPHM